jgi:hypothetical protein
MFWSLRLILVALVAVTMFANTVAAEDDEHEVNLWPVMQYANLPDGKHRAMMLFYLYHRTTNPDGSTHSFNFLNYVRAPDFSALLPLFFHFGADQHKHTMIVPLWFQGPGYAAAPLLASASWTKDDGGKALWITPFIHRDRKVDGSLDDFHVVNYLHGDHYDVVVPVAYAIGEAGKRHYGLVPAWFSGPGYWTVPLALTLSRKDRDGGRNTWVTPLFHLDRTASGAVSSVHFVNYFRFGDTHLVFPIAWRFGDEANRHYGVVPFWLQGPDYWICPPALSAQWWLPDGGNMTWMTPLAHTRSDAAGDIASFHVLNYFHSSHSDIFFPLVWLHRRGDRRSGCVFPFYYSGRHWWCAPLALSAGWTEPGKRNSLWLTPLFHTDSDSTAGSTSMHVLTYFSGRQDGSDGEPARWHKGYRVIFPLFYRTWRDQDGSRSANTGIIPLLFSGPRYTVVPPALSARWQGSDGSVNTWVTPLFHRRVAANGRSRSMHAVNYLSITRSGVPDAEGHPSASKFRGILPLYYRWSRTAHGSTAKHSGLLPFWLSGPHYRMIPPALTVLAKHADGGTSTWITPLFHRNRDAAGAVTSMHALNYFQARDFGMIFPFACWIGPPGARHVSVVPFVFQGRDYCYVPPLLSRWRRRNDGSDSLWITPLFHRDRNADGSLRHLHVLTYVRTRHLQLWFPFAYSSRHGEAKHVGVVPFYFTGARYWTAPLALSAGWKRGDGGSSTWITPLVHVDRGNDGCVEHMHAATYFHGKNYRVAFPLFYSLGAAGEKHSGFIPLYVAGPRYWAAPLALSAGWKKSGGGSSTWITPLFHIDRDQSHTVTGFHAANYIQSSHGKILFPIAWSIGDREHRRLGLLPLWLSGPDYAVSPPLLSAWWRRSDGGGSLWVTPLFHKTSDSSGKTYQWHALNIFHHRTTTVFFPLAWSRGAAGERKRVILPLYFQGPHHLVVAPLYFRRNKNWMAPLVLSAGWTTAAGRTTTAVTPFFHRTTAADGTLQHQHLLTYFGTKEFSAAFPLYWRWRGDAGGSHRLIAPFYYQHAHGDGGRTHAILPALFSYRTGKHMDTSLPYQLFPFVVQRAGDGHELNVLWRLFHLRTRSNVDEVMVGPLWSSEHHAGAPTKWQILGGLLARDCNYKSGSSRYYAFWIFPLGKRSHFAPTAAAPVAEPHIL